MQITSTELKTNLGKYLRMAIHQDIYITRNGRNIAKLTNPTGDRMAMLDRLVGAAINAPVPLEEAKSERLERQ